MREIWFWQDIVTPHMGGLALALARKGCKVTYVAESPMTEDRKALGWSQPTMDRVQLYFAPNRRAVADCVATAGSESIHLCQGMRGNGLISFAQQCLDKRGLQQWVVMETVDDNGWRRLLKRVVYAALFRRHRARTRGVLALGHRTPGWVVDRGMPRSLVFPFAYFLEDRPPVAVNHSQPEVPFRFAFVGQFIKLKRAQMLMDALAALEGDNAELVMVGGGPLERAWRAHAEQRLPGRVRWIGKLPSAEVIQLLAEVDCLVLPSRYDGWGAVVSEALMCGTPAICSDRCGAAGAVSASGVGGVFDSEDLVGLTTLLSRAFAAGKPSSSDRLRLSNWAASLGATAGASYLLDIFEHMDGFRAPPEAPWRRGLK